jgi:tRNA (adenine57-N1/adenine58-N1)-methyltransferase catalytic subunit
MKILLLGKDNFLVNTDQDKFTCKYGSIDLKKIKVGKKIKSSIGYEFVAAEPSIIDKLRKCKRLPQVITPKDAAQIVAETGLSEGWKCLDSGAGSGFLSLFIANYVAPGGSVTAYEKEKDHCNVVKENAKFCSLDKTIKVKNKDILKGFSEKNLDMITLDMKYAEKVVKKAHKALKPGGWLVIYSPHIEQQREAKKIIDKLSFVSVKTIENIQREWTTDYGFSHPKYRGLMHTGFLTFARKV